MFVHTMIKYCDGSEETYLEILTDLHVFRTPHPFNTKKLFLECVCLYVWTCGWTYVCLCASLAPEQFDAYYRYPVFNVYRSQVDTR
jgi:hypothetical protein